MALKYTIKMDVECEVGFPEILVHDELFMELSRRLAFQHAVVRLDKFTFERIDPSDRLRFKYEIKLRDGRKWTQTVIFSKAEPTPGEDEDPMMSFNVSDDWKLTEFSSHRQVRKAVLSLRNAYPYILSVVGKYEVTP